jgi:AAA+ superfamily predicted ATPase
MSHKKRKAAPKPLEDQHPGDHFDLTNEIGLLIRSHYSLVYLETKEEERAESLLKHLADDLNMPFFTWTSSQGLQRTDFGEIIYGTADIKVALNHIESSKLAAIYHLKNAGPFISDEVVGARLSDIVRQFAQVEKAGAFVLTGQDIKIPNMAEPHTAYLKLPPPNRQDYARLLQEIYNDLSARMQIQIEMDEDDLNRLLNNLNGLTLIEAEKVLTKALIEDGKLSPEDIQLVIEAKKTIIEREGLLEYFPVKESMADIADMESLKAWLEKRKSIITEPDRARDFGLPFPKGILLLGIPGSGKSLCAKAVAMEWDLPLLRMDPSGLYNKYIGESEKNFKRAMETAEKMSPVVLWIDEIEKAFSSGESEDGGVSLRVLGTFLSWLQDRQGDVFIVATSNDVMRLPPEFLRKGRFDELFFVDLPDPEVRAAIFDIHLRRRKRNPKKYDLQQLTGITDGFSGAEIEQVVVSALYTAFSENTSLTTKHLIQEVSKTTPLSKTRAEDINFLRQWAQERTVPAQ